jgi:hypothetical protein
MSLAASAFVPLALSQVAVIWTILLGSIMGCSGVVFLLNLPQARTRRSVAPEIGTQVLTRRELRQYREVMLDKMQATWIKGVLEQSLHGTPLIALELQEQTDAVVRPWNHVLQEFDPPPRVLPHGTRISEVFEAAGGKLLILGEAGSGKTTLLLDLARDLLEQARSDDARPLPVVFNLAAWATRRQPLAAWLVEELHDPNKYNVPRAVAQHWIATHQLLPLLDGLDEVAAPHRTACVEALNAYQAEHDVVPLVVCSRTADYPGRTARVRLHLSTAVVLQPLTPEQIRAYLAGAGMDVTALRAVLGEDPLLLDLASTPLMLSFMIQAYPDLDTLPRSGATTIPERQRELFGAYVEHMLYRRRRPVVPRYTPQETVRWLSWLAQGMLRHNQSVFYLEHLQPTWLATSQQRWAYIVSGVSSIGLVYTIAGLLLGILASGLIVILGLDELADAVLFAGVVLGLAFGMVTGLGFGLGEALQRADEIHIRPVETMRWSRPPAGKMWSWAVLGGLLGAAAGALFGAMTVYKVTGWAAVLAGAWAGMPAGALAGGLFAGVRMRAVETRARPNQGIWRSARSALRGGLVFALVFGLCGGGLFGLAYGLTTGMYNEPADMRSVLADCIATSAAVALLIGTLSCGGDVCLWHLVLRLVLWRRHCMPLNYVRFLNEAADRSLLRKVEGGYIFAHRLLLEYLATPDSAQDAHAAPGSVR